MSGKYKRIKVSVSLIIVFFVMAFLTSCSDKKPEKVPSSAPVEKVQNELTAVVIDVDEELDQLTMREIGADVSVILNYVSSSQIINKYGSEIEGDDVQAGQIFDVKYGKDDFNIVSMSIPEDVWEYEEVRKFSIDPNKKAIEVAGEIYRYTNQTFFTDLSKMISVMEINDQDIISVRGIGIDTYSVTRVRGHGYVKLKNYDNFVGGTLSIGKSINLPVSNNMLVAVKEGNYKVSLSKGAAKAVKNVVVKSEQESIVDFSEYIKIANKVGVITFKIEPEGADLYLNKKAIDYSEPISLNYGLYDVRVEMTGYTTYTGRINVQDAAKVISINLIDETAKVEGDNNSTQAPDNTKTPASENGSEQEAVHTKKIDSNHTITVNEPEGVEVYLDNVYKGLAPITFTKVIGSQTITLSKHGYVTKSYSVDILDDDENVSFKFSKLVKSEG